MQMPPSGSHSREGASSDFGSSRIERGPLARRCDTESRGRPNPLADRRRMTQVSFGAISSARISDVLGDHSRRPRGFEPEPSGRDRGLSRTTANSRVPLENLGLVRRFPIGRRQLYRNVSGRLPGVSDDFSMTRRISGLHPGASVMSGRAACRRSGTRHVATSEPASHRPEGRTVRSGGGSDTPPEVRGLGCYPRGSGGPTDLVPPFQLRVIGGVFASDGSRRVQEG